MTAINKSNRFPVALQGLGLIDTEYANGVWQVRFDGDAIAPIGMGEPPGEFISYNSATGAFGRTSFAEPATVVAGTDDTQLTNSAGVAAAIAARGVDAVWTTTPSGATRTIRDRLGEAPVSFRDFTIPTEPGVEGAINRAIQAVAARGAAGGAVVIADAGGILPLTGPVIVKSGVALLGDGAPTLRLANGVNTTMIESEGFAALTGTTSAAGVEDVALVGIHLDGNLANNLAAPAGQGHGLAVFGRRVTVMNVTIENTYRRGCHLEYTNTPGAGVSPYDCYVDGLETNVTGEEGFWNGVSDAHVIRLNVRSAGQNADNTYDAVHLKRSARMAVVNAWRGGDAANTHKNTLYIGANGAGTTITGAHLETGATSNLSINGDGCDVQATVYSLVSGVQVALGASRCGLNILVEQVAPFDTTLKALELSASAQNNSVDLRVRGASGGWVNFANSGGGNMVTARGYADETAVLVLGTPLATDAYTVVANHATQERCIEKRASRDTAINGVGTTQAGAAEITSGGRIYTVVGQAAFVLPAAAAGRVFDVVNVGATAALIYPAPGQKFVHLATDASVSLAVGRALRIVGASTTEWAVP